MQYLHEIYVPKKFNIFRLHPCVNNILMSHDKSYHVYKFNTIIRYKTLVLTRSGDGKPQSKVGTVHYNIS